EIDKDFVFLCIDGDDFAALGAFGLPGRGLGFGGLVEAVKFVQGNVAECVFYLFIELVGGSIFLFVFIVTGHDVLTKVERGIVSRWGGKIEMANSSSEESGVFGVP